MEENVRSGFFYKIGCLLRKAHDFVKPGRKTSYHQASSQSFNTARRMLVRGPNFTPPSPSPATLEQRQQKESRRKNRNAR